MAKPKPKPEAARPVSGLLSSDMEELALYNAECARGIVHTSEWDERMAALQRRFDADVAGEARVEAGRHVRLRRQQVNLR